MTNGIEWSDWMIYPIEIRPGVVAKVQAPRDLTKAEAEKIGRVMLALGDGAGERANAAKEGK